MEKNIFKELRSTEHNLPLQLIGATNFKRKENRIPGRPTKVWSLVYLLHPL